MRSPRVLLFAALAALAAMLFAQASIAAAAWEAAPAPCHEPTPNVCAQHCVDNDLTLDLPRIKLPPPAAASVVIAVPAPSRAEQRPRRGVPPAGPPPRILFQSFRS